MAESKPTQKTSHIEALNTVVAAHHEQRRQNTHAYDKQALRLITDAGEVAHHLLGDFFGCVISRPGAEQDAALLQLKADLQREAP